MTLRKDRFRLSYPHKAFTLVELLVVVAVLALLASIVFSNLTGAREQAKISNALSFQSNMHNLLGADLVGWWNFDDEDNRYKDLSGYGNNGSCTSCPTLVDGVPGTSGKALEFDNNFLEINHSPELNLPSIITVSAWIRLVISSGAKTIISKANGDTVSTTYWMDIRSDNSQIYVGGYTPTGSGAYTNGNYNFSINTWYHLLWTDNGVEHKIYVNGEEIRSAESTPRVTHEGSVIIGARNPGGGQFDGKLDDVRIYSRALTAYEVQTLYAQTKDNYLAEEQ